MADGSFAPYTFPAIDAAIAEAIRGGAVVAFSLSGGKDSGAVSHGASLLLDDLGHPRGDRIAIHADLGRAEWRTTPATVEAQAARLGLPLMVVRHGQHDMPSRWAARFEAGKRRYEALEVFNLIGPWSSASLRFCTSEMKTQVIERALRKRYPGRTVVSVVGLRREEKSRRDAPVSKARDDADRRDGSRLLSWHPGVDWTAGEVFARHDAFEIPLHEAYTRWGSSRVSCAFCVMQGEADMRAAAACPDNRALALHLVDLEARSTFSFQPSRWLGDVVRDLLPEGLARDLGRAQERAALRRLLEASLPADLRYVKGWPTRVPTTGEAQDIVEVREAILGMHGLKVRYPTAHAVRDRFAELMAAKPEAADA